MATDNTVNLEFDVTRQSLTRKDEEVVASGAMQTLVANFKFCNTWRGLYKFCRFEGGGGIFDVRIENDKCVVPWEVIEAPSFTLGCYGTLSSDTILTTKKLRVKVYQSINFIADPALPDDSISLLSQYEQLVNQSRSEQEANNAQQQANNARTDEMVSEVTEIVETNLAPTLTAATNATNAANAAAERANNAVVDLESGNIPIITTAQIDSAFN